MQPHRGTLILVLGLLSLLGCAPFGIAAWIMGRGDLKAMDAGRMDPAGRDHTKAGFVCGIIGTVLTVIGLILGLVAAGLFLGLTVVRSQSPAAAVEALPLVVHDLAADFSTNRNPNGVWSYGSENEVGPGFELMTFIGGASMDNRVIMEYWTHAPMTQPTIYHNATSQTALSLFGQAVRPPGTVVLVAAPPGAPNPCAVARFTTPAGAGGTYRVETEVVPDAHGSWQGGTDYHVLKNGTEIFGQALPAGASTGYTNVLSLAAGETIDFVLGPGQAENNKAKSLQVRARVATVGH